MSKQVKDLITQDVARRLEGVSDCVLADIIGLDANSTVLLRRQLREKDIHMLVVKNSLARRATEGTSLAPAFDSMDGSLAVVWGGVDFVSLVKEVTQLDKGKEFEKFAAKGGVMDGESLSPAQLTEISKWPSREEQLSILLGQILSPGANLVGALLGPGGGLASQIKQKGEEDDA